MDTVHLVRKIKGFDTVTVSIFTPYHGTVLRTVAIDNGWLDRDYLTKHTTSSSALNMPKPFVSSFEIDGLMRSIPLYIYFPETEWERIRRAEISDKEGERILEHYSAIYSRDFLGENQDHKKVLIDGATGCKSNAKDSLFLGHVSGIK